MHLGRQVSATELGPRYQADRRHAPYKESRICFSCLIPVRNRAAMRSSPPAPEQSPVIAVVSTGAGAIASDYRGPAAADYAVAGVGRTIRRPAAGRHGAGLRGFGAPGRGFARADHPDHESARKGQPHVGQTFDRAGLVRLLTNVLYCGEVRHKGKVYPGEQAAIINRKIWQQAQVLLRQTKGWERVPKRPGSWRRAAGRKAYPRDRRRPGPRVPVGHLKTE